MSKLEKDFFWGVLAGAAAIAIAGAMALTCSFRSAKAGGGPPEVHPRGKGKPRPVGVKAGRAHPPR